MKKLITVLILGMIVPISGMAQSPTMPYPPPSQPSSCTTVCGPFMCTTSCS